MELALRLNDANSFVQLALGAMEIEQGTDLDVRTLDRLKLEKLKDLLSKSLSFVGNRLLNQSKQEVAVASKTGDILLEIDDVQFFEPRGRFKLLISSESIVLDGKQFSCLSALENISHMACIPSNCTAKKEGEDFLAVRFKVPVKINGKEVRHILGNLSRSPLKMITAKDGMRDIETIVVTTVLENASDVKIIRPQKHLFQSISQQKAYLRCYKGIQEGAIYPLENGVVFVKPLLFIPAEEIASLTAGRGGGAGNTRYVDLKIETVDEKEHEFTNIEREELAALQMYVKGYLEARSSREAAQQRAQGRKRTEIVDVDESGDDDERTATRQGSTAGNIDQIDDEDSDESGDDDYETEGSSDDSSDDSDDSSDDDDDSSVATKDTSSDNGKRKHSAGKGTCKSNEKVLKEGVSKNDKKQKQPPVKIKKAAVKAEQKSSDTVNRREGISSTAPINICDEVVSNESKVKREIDASCDGLTVDLVGNVDIDVKAVSSQPQAAKKQRVEIEL